MSHAGRTVSCGGSCPSSIFTGMLPLGEPGESLFGFSEASCAPPGGGTDVDCLDVLLSTFTSAG